MRTLDIGKVEQSLKIKLPQFFIDFHEQEQALIQQFRTYSNDFDYIIISSDADWMIEHNRDFLKLPREEYICRGKICIGTDGCGNDSFIKLSGNDTRVFFLDHEDAHEWINEENNDFDWENKGLPKYDSLEAYLKFYIQIYTG